MRRNKYRAPIIVLLVVILLTILNLVLTPFAQNKVRKDFDSPTTIKLVPLPIGYYADINHTYADYGGCGVCLGFTSSFGTTKGYYVGIAGIYKFIEVSSADQNPN